MPIEVAALEAEVRRALGPLAERVRFDASRLGAFAREIAAGRLGPDANRLPEPPTPAGAGDLDALPRPSTPLGDRLRGLGREALERGEVACAVLNGGMATRFGGGVKGVVPAIEGRSFLEIKRAQARAAGTPFVVMNSFATHAPTLAFLRERGLEEGVIACLQSVSVRLTPAGEVFREADGRPSLYAPGHGDFPETLREQGVLEKLEAAGVRAILLSNVDNLGAEPDPVVIGYHLEHGRPITCEVAEADPGDQGGAPARVRGRLQVVEGFRFPRGYDFAHNRYLACNTFLFATEALRADEPLTWFYVEKEVDGRIAVQMERLVNELTARLPTAFLAVPRSGAQGRFLPIKTREDLARLERDPVLRRRFGRG
jgi:UTP--glucose-1-phosphate uridylyltransferase